MSDNYLPAVDYRDQPLTVGAVVTFISDVDGAFSSGTVAHLAETEACIDSGGALVVRKAFIHRTVGKPATVRFRTVARIDAPETPEASDG